MDTKSLKEALATISALVLRASQDILSNHGLRDLEAAIECVEKKWDECDLQFSLAALLIDQTRLYLNGHRASRQCMQKGYEAIICDCSTLLHHLESLRVGRQKREREIGTGGSDPKSISHYTAVISNLITGDLTQI